jgi:hypothetical protein
MPIADGRFVPEAVVRKSNVMEVDVRSTRDSGHTYRGPARPLCADFVAEVR